MTGKYHKMGPMSTLLTNWVQFKPNLDDDVDYDSDDDGDDDDDGVHTIMKLCCIAVGSECTIYPCLIVLLHQIWDTSMIGPMKKPQRTYNELHPVQFEILPKRKNKMILFIHFMRYTYFVNVRIYLMANFICILLWFTVVWILWLYGRSWFIRC